MKLHERRNDFGDFAAALKLLGNPMRLMLFRLLAEKEMCVCELEAVMKVEQSRISHSLKPLKLLGVIKSHYEGKMVIYSLTEPAFDSGIAQLVTENVALTKREIRLIEAVCKTSPRCGLTV